MPSSIPSGGFCDTPSSSIAWDGARRLGAAKSPSTARDDDGVSSSIALAVFSGRESSSSSWRRLFLLCVVTCRREVCLTMQCRRTRFFVVYDATARHIICPNVHRNEQRGNSKRVCADPRERTPGAPSRRARSGIFASSLDDLRGRTIDTAEGGSLGRASSPRG